MFRTGRDPSAAPSISDTDLRGKVESLERDGWELSWFRVMDEGNPYQRKTLGWGLIARKGDREVSESSPFWGVQIDWVYSQCQQ